jgi:hypothetical protein
MPFGCFQQQTSKVHANPPRKIRHTQLYRGWITDAGFPSCFDLFKPELAEPAGDLSQNAKSSGNP